MIRFGVLQLQKHNNCGELAGMVFAVSAALFFGLFVSCASRPPVIAVDPLSVIDPEAAVYVVIPEKIHSAFVEKLLITEIAGLSQNDAHRIADRMGTCWIAGGFRKESGKYFQVAASGNYPELIVKSVFTRKNGWIEKNYQGKPIQYSYYQNLSSGVETAFLSSTFVCVSNQVLSMVEQYDRSIMNERIGNDFEKFSYKQDVSLWLSDHSSTDIRFYLQNPSLYTTQLLGKGASLGIETVTGVVSENKTKEGVFNLELTIQLNDPRTIKAAVALLKIALFPVPAKIIPIDNTHIVITEITLSGDALISMISR